ncbi:MAG TPA: hypothetical protein QF901_05935 [Gammaproteobacteria bacterium]|nr:hypothetical protein [Gammaproteobacteria bacterium]
MTSLKHSKHTARKRPSAIVVSAFLFCLIVVPAHAEEFEEMSRFVDLMQNFLVLMDSMYEAASNPEHAALLQLNSLEDLYKTTGNLNEMVAVYRDVIEQSTNPTVRRLARMRLADALKESGQVNAAIEVLKQAIDETVGQSNRQ